MPLVECDRKPEICKLEETCREKWAEGVQLRIGSLEAEVSGLLVQRTKLQDERDRLHAEKELLAGKIERLAQRIGSALVDLQK